MIDRGRRRGETGGELEDSALNTGDAKPRALRRARLWSWLVLVALATSMVWMNGQGLRWLAPMAAARWMRQSGAQVTFTLEGSLTGGIAVKDLRLLGYKSLAGLSATRVRPVYRIMEVLRGRLQGLEIDGLHVDMQLGMEQLEAETTAKEPFDPEKIAQAMRAVMGSLVPLAVDLKDVRLEIAREGQQVFSLASSTLHHAAGASSFDLDLGVITDATGRAWPAQKSLIDWEENQLRIARVDPLPGVSVSDFRLRLPVTGGPTADAQIRIGDAVFVMNATPGFSSLSVDLREGHLLTDSLAQQLALKLPASASLTSLAVHLDGLLPDPATATGTARVLLENVVFGDWSLPELGLGMELEGDVISLAASGRMLGGGFSVDAEAPVTRAGRLGLGDVSGHFNLTDLSNWIAGLSERFKRIDPEAPVPASRLDGDFQIAMHDLRPGLAKIQLMLKPAEPQSATAISLAGRWQPGQPVTAVLEIDGLKATGEYEPRGATYQLGVECNAFQSTRIDAWLAMVRAQPAAVIALTGKWSGSGDLKSAAHRGVITLAQAELKRPGMAPVTAQGAMDYHWPDGFLTRDLRLQVKNQIITGEAGLAGGLLELKNLRWEHEGKEIGGGSASLPVPADMARWRDTFARDLRPVAVVVESKVLPLVLLRDWLPAAAQLDARSSGCLQLKVAGSYAEPTLDARLEVKGLRSPQQAKLPPADLIFTLTGRDGRLNLDGHATAQDFPAAVMSASMPFSPAAWAENPASIAREKLTAKLTLPRLDLSRFTTLVSSASKLSGFLTGNVELAGEVAKPVFHGQLDLSEAGMELRDKNRPPVTGLGASVTISPERVTLKSLKATLAGGTLQGSGTLALDSFKPGLLDIRLTGSHLPVLRSESVILRTNADLRLGGTWQRATLSGSLSVVDSLFYRDIELLPIGTPFTIPAAAALPKIDTQAHPASSMPEPFRNWTLDVLARTQNPFLICGNFATGKIVGSVRIGGTFSNPAPDGEVVISDFRAALPFSTLSVQHGTARFSPATGFDPLLEIRGSAAPRPYQVNAFVYGRASNPQLVLTSSPPLPDNEIMTLLATGTTTSGLENPQAASSRAMQLLAEELRRGRFAVGKRLRPLLGLLDKVDFSLAEADPYSGDSFSTATLTITDRWLVSAGMGAEGDSRVMGIWRFTFY